VGKYTVHRIIAIILPVVLYGCETWSLTLREEHRLRVFENRFLRRIFGPKRDEVTGEWRKMHNEELHNLYSSPDIIRQVKSTRMRWAGHVARMGDERKVYKVLVGKPEGKRPLGRPRRRMGSEWILGRLAWGVWIGFDWLRAGCCECGDESSGSCATELISYRIIAVTKVAYFLNTYQQTKFQDCTPVGAPT
jgi:hypothetical protein